MSPVKGQYVFVGIWVNFFRCLDDGIIQWEFTPRFMLAQDQGRRVCKQYYDSTENSGKLVS
jgi:hypothetical protein